MMLACHTVEGELLRKHEGLMFQFKIEDCAAGDFVLNCY